MEKGRNGVSDVVGGIATSQQQSTRVVIAARLMLCHNVGFKSIIMISHTELVEFEGDK
jgi:hypothetical protein